jgi:hypothetical protein
MESKRRLTLRNLIRKPSASHNKLEKVDKYRKQGLEEYTSAVLREMCTFLKIELTEN